MVRDARWEWGLIVELGSLLACKLIDILLMGEIVYSHCELTMLLQLQYSIPRGFDILLYQIIHHLRDKCATDCSVVLNMSSAG